MILIFKSFFIWYVYGFILIGFLYNDCILDEGNDMVIIFFKIDKGKLLLFNEL